MSDKQNAKGDVERVARALSVPEHHTTWDTLTAYEQDLYYQQAGYAVAELEQAGWVRPEVYEAAVKGRQDFRTAFREAQAALTPQPAVGGEVERARNTMRASHHYWLIAAKEALQGDLGKLRRLVAISEGRTAEDVVQDMAAALTAPPVGDEAVQIERDIRIAIWNGARWQGSPQEVAQSLIQKVMTEPSMVRALSAIAALHPQQSEGWRPIETAPKGENVLVWGRYTDVSVGRLAGRTWTGVADGKLAIESQSDFGTSYIELDPLTHWRPLPAAPTPD